MKEFLVNSEFGLGLQFIKVGGRSNRKLGLVGLVEATIEDFTKVLRDELEVGVAIEQQKLYVMLFRLSSRASAKQAWTTGKGPLPELSPVAGR